MQLIPTTKKVSTAFDIEFLFRNECVDNTASFDFSFFCRLMVCLLGQLTK